MSIRPIEEILTPVQSDGGGVSQFALDPDSISSEHWLTADETHTDVFVVNYPIIINLGGHTLTIKQKSIDGDYCILINADCMIINGNIIGNICIDNNAEVIIGTDNNPASIDSITVGIAVKSGTLSLSEGSSVQSVSGGISCIADNGKSADIDVFGSISSVWGGDSIIASGNGHADIDIYDGAIISGPVDVSNTTSNVNILGGKFDETISTPNNTGYITGGKFKILPDENYIAPGYALASEADVEGYTEVIQLCQGGHTFGDWVVTTEPTTNSEGLQMRECQVCGYQETQSIPKKEEEIVMRDLLVSITPSTVTRETDVDNKTTVKLQVDDYAIDGAQYYIKTPGMEDFGQMIDWMVGMNLSWDIEVPDTVPNGTYDVQLKGVYYDQSNIQTVSIPVNRAKEEFVMNYSFSAEKITAPTGTNNTVELSITNLEADDTVEFKTPTAGDYCRPEVAGDDGIVTASISVPGDAPNGNYDVQVRITHGDGTEDTGVATILIDRESSDTSDTMIHFTENQVQAMVTMIFQYVNARISERIVQSVVAGDTKRVASADAAKTYTDAQVDELRTAVMGMNHWDIIPVTGALPETLAEKTIYLQRDSEEDTTWEMNILTSQGVANIGRTEIDLSNYWSKDNIDGITNALFGSSLFNTKISDAINTALSTYTDSTLDLRYWKKDDISGLVAAVAADTDAVAVIATALTGKFYRKDNADDLAALITALRTDKAGTQGYDNVYLQIAALKTYLGISDNVALSAEAVANAIKVITATTDLSETYLAVSKMKELLGITGDLTVEAVEAAIKTITGSDNHWDKTDASVAELRARLNIPEATVLEPISNDKIVSIVNDAFANTVVNLES